MAQKEIDYPDEKLVCQISKCESTVRAKFDKKLGVYVGKCKEHGTMNYCAGGVVVAFRAKEKKS